MIGKSIICCKNTTSMLYHVMLNQNKRFKRFQVPYLHVLSKWILRVLHTPRHVTFMTILQYFLSDMIDLFIIHLSHATRIFFSVCIKSDYWPPTTCLIRQGLLLTRRAIIFKNYCFYDFVFFFKWAPIYIKFKVVSANMYR